MQAEEKNWLPVALLQKADELFFRRMQFDSEPFRKPFFEDDISRVKWKYAVNHPAVHTVEAAALLHEQTAPVQEPDLLVFHISRCGSTLLTQLLGLDEQITTLSEMPLLDELLALPETTPEKNKLIRVTANLMRRGTKHLVIKCDCWHLLHYKTLRACFPETPVVFLYRNPAEVWQSHRKLPGIHTVPGLLQTTQLPGFVYAGVVDIAAGDYTGKLFETFFRNMLEHAGDENVLLLNYNEGALPFTLKAAAHAGITPGENHLQQMQTRAAFNAKKPGEVFQEEQQSERIPEFLEEAFALYKQLDGLRKKNL